MDVKFELEGVKEALEMVSPDLARKAIRSALDKTGTFTKKEIIDGITGEYNIKAKDVRSRIEVIRTRIDRLEVWLKIKSPKLSLPHFGARQAPKGVLVNIRKDKLTFISEAWLRERYAAIRKIRPWPKGTKDRAKYLKMKGLPGPSVPDMAKHTIKRLKNYYIVLNFMKQKFLDEIKKRSTIKLK